MLLDALDEGIDQPPDLGLCTSPDRFFHLTLAGHSLGQALTLLRAIQDARNTVQLANVERAFVLQVLSHPGQKQLPVAEVPEV